MVMSNGDGSDFGTTDPDRSKQIARLEQKLEKAKETLRLLLRPPPKPFWERVQVIKDTLEELEAP